MKTFKLMLHFACHPESDIMMTQDIEPEQPQPNVAVINGQVFSSASPLQLPPVPDARLMLDKCHSLWVYKKPTWADNHFPAVAFVPSKP
jgi:hypothetical protein